MSDSKERLHTKRRRDHQAMRARLDAAHTAEHQHEMRVATLEAARAKVDGELPDATEAEREVAIAEAYVDLLYAADPVAQAAADVEATPGEQLPRLWRATDLRPAAQPRWLAKGRLPRAAISLLVGDEGIGKSLLWVWIVAAVTTGRALPAFGIPARAPQHVILVITEDDWSTTVLARLLVADANLDYIRVICTDDDGSGAPTFPNDMYLIIEADPVPALVVVDAWLDTVPRGLAVKDPQQARRALHPWREAATATDAAILLLTHTNRVASSNARDKYGATGELRKKARMTLFAQQDDDGHLLVGPEKSNTTKPLPASKFTIDGIQHFDATEDHDGTVPLLRYVGDSDLTARDHIADAYDSDHGDDAQDRSAAGDWLTDYLTVEGSTESKAVKLDAKKVGISERTLKRAAKSIKVVVESRGFPRVTWWSLIEQVPTVDDEVIASQASQATADPMSPQGGPTGPTGDDLHKRNGPTVSKLQSGHEQSSGPTGGLTVAPGALTDDSPGQTDRVAAALARAKAVVDKPEPPTVRTPGRRPGQWLGSGQPIDGAAS